MMFPFRLKNVNLQQAFRGSGLGSRIFAMYEHELSPGCVRAISTPTARPTSSLLNRRQASIPPAFPEAVPPLEESGWRNLSLIQECSLLPHEVFD
jgi:hypothetical protein